MKKMYLSLMLVIFSFVGLKAQLLVGRETAIQIKNSTWGGTQNAIVYLPDDYYTTSANTKYPLILFYHGYGEIGNSTTDLSKLLKQGLPTVIEKGQKIQAINPVDKKLYKFIVISPQHWGWTTTPDCMDLMLKDIVSKYRVDTTRIYHTGLSAGGQGTVQMTLYSQKLSNTIAAIVPMSPAATNIPYINNFKFFKESKIHAWFFSGSSDAGPYTTNAKAYSDSINKYNPGFSKVSLFSGGHCCWANVYDTSYRVNGLSIYEWMLQYTTAKDVIVTPPVDNSKPKILGSIQVDGKTIIIYDNNTWEYK